MNKKYAFSVILAGILWGLITVFIKNLSSYGMTALNISLVRMAVSAPLFALFVAIKDVSKLKIRLRDIPLFIGTGIVSVVLFNCSYFYTMIHSQASVAVVLLYTSPVFIMIISAIFFREKITPRKLIALGMTLCGCVFVAGLIGNGYKITPLILLTGLSSGFFYAMYTVFGRIALKKYDTLTITAYTFIFGLIGSLFIGKPVETVSIVCKSPVLLPWCLGIGIICTVLPYFFYTKGLSGIESGKAAILVAVEPLVGAVLGMTVYHESHSVFKILGISLILGAIILLNMPEKSLSKE